MDEKRVGDLICMLRSHLLYINKGKNIAILKDNRNLPLRLGYPRSSISQHALYIIDASEGGKATRAKIIYLDTMRLMITHTLGSTRV